MSTTIETGSQWHRLGPTGRANTRVTCVVISVISGVVTWAVPGCTKTGSMTEGDFLGAFVRRSES